MPDAFTSSVETLAPEYHEYRRNPKRKQWGAFLDEVIFVLILIVALYSAAMATLKRM